MRAETDKAKVEAFMTALGRRVEGPGRIYFAGGATALLYGWRTSTIDIDLKADPEPPKFFEAIAILKENWTSISNWPARMILSQRFPDGVNGACLLIVAALWNFFTTIHTARRSRRFNVRMSGTCSTFVSLSKKNYSCRTLARDVRRD